MQFKSTIARAICHLDKDMFVLIMNNLVSNAFKFTDPGGVIQVVLKYNLSPADKVPEQIEITVSDSGIGIPEEKLENVFNRFYQADQSLSRRSEGCGLGLSIVKFIVDAHRGKISVQSKLGNGSTFTVSIPLNNHH